jgi:hypothetical protein
VKTWLAQRRGLQALMIMNALLWLRLREPSGFAARPAASPFSTPRAGPAPTDLRQAMVHYRALFLRPNSSRSASVLVAPTAINSS